VSAGALMVLHSEQNLRDREGLGKRCVCVSLYLSLCALMVLLSAKCEKCKKSLTKQGLSFCFDGGTL
jgi:hypothetical protein